MLRKVVNLRALLLGDRSVKQTIFKNTFWLVLGELVGRTLKVLFLVYVARVLGASDYGVFTFGLSFVFLFIVISDLGLSSIVTREFSRDKESEGFYSSVLSLKILLSFLALVLIFLSSLFAIPNPLARSVTWILSAYIVIYNFNEIIYAFFRAYQKMEYEAWAKIFLSVVLVGSGTLVFLKYPTVSNLSFIYLFAISAGLLFALVIFHRKVFKLRLSWKPSVWKRFLAMSWPLAIPQIFGTLYFHIDSVMLGRAGLFEENGWYSAAYKVADVIIIVPALLSQSFYPLLSRFFKESSEKLKELWSYQMRIMIFLAIPLVVGGFILAPRLVDLIYGSGFAPAARALQILIWVIGLIFLYNPFYRLLIASNQQIRIFWVILAGVVINVMANSLLIPPFTMYGAAMATVITYVFILLSMGIASVRLTPVSLFSSRNLETVFISVASSFLMYLALMAVADLNVLLATVIGISVYGAGFGVLYSLAGQVKNLYGGQD